MVLPTFLLAMSLSAPPADPTPVTPVAAVDLDRYAGRWFEIARFPNRFQKSCAGEVVATYERRDDGRIRVVNRCTRADGSVNEAEGVARPVEGGANARLKVRFAPGWLSALPFVWADYWVIGLADDYRWALVGTPDRRYLWVLCRTREMAPADWDAAVAAARRNGFEVSRLERTRQKAAPDS
jgi:apolipoprotein D and lipocalin family protein